MITYTYIPNPDSVFYDMEYNEETTTYTWYVVFNGI